MEPQRSPRLHDDELSLFINRWRRGLLQIERWKEGEGVQGSRCITDVIYVLTDLGFRGEGKLNTRKFMDIYEIFLEACGVCLLQGDFVLINIKKLIVEGNIWVVNC